MALCEAFGDEWLDIQPKSREMLAEAAMKAMRVELDTGKLAARKESPTLPCYGCRQDGALSSSNITNL